MTEDKLFTQEEDEEFSGLEEEELGIDEDNEEAEEDNWDENIE